MTPEALLAHVRRGCGRILGIRVHGYLLRSVGVIVHYALRLNNVVSRRTIMSTLDELDFSCPFIFELETSEDRHEIPRDCAESREMLIECASKP